MRTCSQVTGPKAGPRRFGALASRLAHLVTSELALAAALATTVMGPAPAYAGPAEGVKDIEELSLEDLLDTETALASKSVRGLRESPGIVTVISRDDIARSGARDLVELLAFVPGMFFGIDNSGVLGLSVRGNWAQEGKVLLLIDGVEVNEGLYSTPHLGIHVPLALIERIEIVRGPGSAIYGGEAELAVIDVITSPSTPRHGVTLSTRLGATEHGAGHSEVSMAVSDVLPALGGLEVTAVASAGRGHLGDGVYRDQDGREMELADSSAHRPLFARVGAKLGGFSFSLLAQHIDLETRDAYVELLDGTAHVSFTGLVGEARLALEPAPGLVITPRLRFSRQLPWRSLDKGFAELFYDKRVDRAEAGIDASWQALPALDLRGGVLVFRDHAVVNDLDLEGFETTFGGADAIEYDALAAYAQVQWDTPVVNFAAGARFESHERCANTFVPRLALTKVLGDFHFKALAAKAFRAPGVENLELSHALTPEDATAFEVEAGYKVSDLLFLSASLFDLTIDRPIIYGFDPARSVESYMNGDTTGSRGFEVEARLRHAGGGADLAYSFYTASGKNQVATYAVPGHDDALLGAPTHKLTVRGFVTLHPGVTVSSSLLLASERTAWVARDASGRSIAGTVPMAAVLGVSAEWEHAFVDALDLSLGLHDLLDRRVIYVQPYHGGHAPYPGVGREIMLRATLHEPLP